MIEALALCAGLWTGIGLWYFLGLVIAALAETLERERGVPVSIAKATKWTVIGMLYCMVLGPLAWPYFGRDELD